MAFLNVDGRSVAYRLLGPEAIGLPRSNTTT